MALGPTDYRAGMAGRLPGGRPQATGTSPETARATATRAPKGTVPPSVGQVVARPKAIGQPDSMPLTAAIARTTSAPSVSPDVANTAVSPAARPRPRMMKNGGLVRKGNVSHGPYTKKC